MGYSLSFKAEQISFEKEHKYVQDREFAKKQKELEDLKAKDKEPISIPQLNERKAILEAKPRVKPIVPEANKQKKLQINQ